MKVIQCVIFTLTELTLTGDEGQLILRNASLHGRKFLDNKSEEILHLHTPQCNNKSSKSSETELPEMYLTSYSKMFEELKLLFFLVHKNA